MLRCGVGGCAVASGGWAAVSVACGIAVRYGAVEFAVRYGVAVRCGRLGGEGGRAKEAWAVEVTKLNK